MADAFVFIAQHKIFSNATLNSVYEVKWLYKLELLFFVHSVSRANLLKTRVFFQISFCFVVGFHDIDSHILLCRKSLIVLGEIMDGIRAVFVFPHSSRRNRLENDAVRNEIEETWVCAHVFFTCFRISFACSFIDLFFFRQFEKNLWVQPQDLLPITGWRHQRFRPRCRARVSANECWSSCCPCSCQRSWVGVVSFCQWTGSYSDRGANRREILVRCKNAMNRKSYVYAFQSFCLDKNIMNYIFSSYVWVFVFAYWIHSCSPELP